MRTKTTKAADGLAGLSLRELQVTKLLAYGFDKHGVMDIMGIRHCNFDFLTASIRKKFKVRTTRDAVAKALEEGVLEDEREVLLTRETLGLEE